MNSECIQRPRPTTSRSPQGLVSSDHGVQTNHHRPKLEMSAALLEGCAVAGRPACGTVGEFLRVFFVRCCRANARAVSIVQWKLLPSRHQILIPGSGEFVGLSLFAPDGHL